MIDLYTFGTPNGWKASIMLEECGLDYKVHTVDIMSGANFDPEYRKISPAHRIPAIVDSEGPGEAPVRVFESAAILRYLSEKTGRFRGNDPIARLESSQWLMIEATGLGPMFSEAWLFANGFVGEASEETVEFGKKRFVEATKRMLGVLDFRLREYEYLAKTYTIADIAAYPWVASHDALGIELDDYVGVRNWYNKLSKRPAVQRGMNVPAK